MKATIVKLGIGLLTVVLSAGTIKAQRPSRKNPAPATQNEQKTDNIQPSYPANIPIVEGSSINDNRVEPSKRPTGAFPDDTSTRTSLVYENLRRDDALYVEKLWREIDIREKMNQPFRYDADDNDGSRLFINILLRAIQSGKVTAFSDERFSQPLDQAAITALTQGRLDTIPSYSPDKIDVIEKLVVTRTAFDPASVPKFRLMEEWVFDREGSRLFCRIIGIAALKTEYLPDGKERNASSVLFWLHYPDLRPLLSQSLVYNPKNMGQGGNMTWEELFESRKFSSYITKSTIENPSNRTLKLLYKDSKLALLEGENTRDKIFNYEQDQWSY